MTGTVTSSSVRLKELINVDFMKRRKNMNNEYRDFTFEKDDGYKTEPCLWVKSCKMMCCRDCKAYDCYTDMSQQEAIEFFGLKVFDSEYEHFKFLSEDGYPKQPCLWVLSCKGTRCKNCKANHCKTNMSQQEAKVFFGLKGETNVG